jgi:integrase
LLGDYWSKGMATGKITKRTVDALKKGKADTFLWDTDCKGFGVKRTPAGKAVFLLQYRLHGGRAGKTKRYTIGPMGTWTPDSARTEAERLMRLVAQGIDPMDALKEQRRIESTLSFTAYVETFTEGYLKTEWGDSWPQAKRQLEMHVVPFLGDTPLPDIGPDRINPILDALRKRPALRRNVWAIVNKLFRWAEKRDDIDKSPMAKMDAPPMAKARKRILSPDELRAVWQASYELDAPRGSFVRLLMITLQRRSEVAGLPWIELRKDEDIWHLPGERAKNGHDHIVPLSDLALAEFDLLGWKRRGLALPCSTGTTPISNFSKTKKALDAAMLPILQKQANERADAEGEPHHEIELKPWRLHDLRRTGTTNLQALGFPIEVTERVINHHRGGEASGIRGVYNLYEYLPEKTRALQAWADHLRQIASGEVVASNVIPLSKAV